MSEKIKKTVSVGGKEFEVEYFITTWPWPTEYKETILEKLSDIPWWIKRNAKELYWKIRYAIQRVYRGYDNLDSISLYAAFIERYTKILSNFQKNLSGHPGTMTEEEWRNILAKMQLHLFFMDEDNVDNILESGCPENWLPTCQSSYEVMDYHKDEFFALFSKYFYHLWD